MSRVAITVVALAAALFAVTVWAEDEPGYVDPNARHPGFVGPCQYHETINLGRTIYLADPGAHQPRFLRDAVTGDPYATVVARVPDADACDGELDDGGATYLEAGAVLYAIDAWSPTFRLVSVQRSGRLVLYQAAWSTTARTAGDYLNLAGRGASVARGPLSFCDERGCVDYAAMPPRRGREAETLVAGILAGRIDPDTIDVADSDAAGRFSVDIQFADETGISLVFACDTRTSTTGIVLGDDVIPKGSRRYVCPPGDPFDHLG